MIQSILHTSPFSHTSIYLSIHLPMCITTNPSIFLSIYLSMYIISTNPSMYLSIYSSFYVFIYQSIYLFIYISFYEFIYQSVLHLFHAVFCSWKFCFNFTTPLSTSHNTNTCTQLLAAHNFKHLGYDYIGLHQSAFYSSYIS